MAINFFFVNNGIPSFLSNFVIGKYPCLPILESATINFSIQITCYRALSSKLSPPFQWKIGRTFSICHAGTKIWKTFYPSLIAAMNKLCQFFLSLSSIAFTIMVNSCSILFSDTCGRAHTSQQLSAFCCICMHLFTKPFQDDFMAALSCKMCVRKFKCFGEINCNGRIVPFVSITQPVT